MIRAPSAKLKAYGFSNITGCIYRFKSVHEDVAYYYHILINSNIEYFARFAQQPITIYQLPESKFVLPGKYRCLSHIPFLLRLSPPSPYIPMPGRYIEKNCQILLNFLE